MKRMALTKDLARPPYKKGFFREIHHYSQISKGRQQLYKAISGGKPFYHVWIEGKMMTEGYLAPCGAYCGTCTFLNREEKPSCSGCGAQEGRLFGGACNVYQCAGEHDVVPLWGVQGLSLRPVCAPV
jgi:hypothetical protein